MKRSHIKSKLHFEDFEGLLNEQTYDVIMKVTTEILTNALKHSGATDIFVSVKKERK